MTTTASAGTQYLRPVPNGTVALPPCDGSRLISQAFTTFPGHIDGDFVAWGANQPSPDTPETTVIVYDLITNATCEQFFGSLTSNIKKLCLAQAQIIAFCERYPNLLSKDWVTFFVLQSNDHFFAAGVGLNGVGLEVHAHRFSSDYVWDARDEYRVVVLRNRVSPRRRKSV